MRSFAPQGRRVKEQHVCATHVDGFWYQDDLNTSFSHTASYGYDGVNRLSSAVATGNSTYNLAFSYTSDGTNGQYGNLSCTAGSCKDLTFSAGTNQITAGGAYVPTVSCRDVCAPLHWRVDAPKDSMSAPLTWTAAGTRRMLAPTAG
jgi:hypothetical protein